jgi:hypothetical protein
LPIILMIDDESGAGKDAFVLAMRDLEKEDVLEKAAGNAVFEAGLLINPGDYVPGFQWKKDKKLTTHALADKVKALKVQLKEYEKYLRKRKDKEVNVCTFLDYINSR